ncbi:unnamed protein product [Prunus armeniaca]
MNGKRKLNWINLSSILMGSTLHLHMLYYQTARAFQATGKRLRDDDEGRVVDILGKRKALEEARQSVMGMGPRLPPFDLQGPPKLPFGIEDVFAEGVEKVDFSKLRRQKKEVNLAMHWQEALAFGEMHVNMVKVDKEI